MHYLHLGDQQIHYVIDHSSSLLTTDGALPFQHWQWDIHRDQPIPLLLQQVSDVVPHVLPASNAVLIFGISENICAAFERLWSNVYFVSAQTSILRRFATRQEHSREKRCFIHLRSQAVDVACFRGNHLLGYNTFDTLQTADIIYYACQFATTLDCFPASTPFYISGQATLCEALAQSLRDYVSKVDVVQTQEEFAHHPLTTVAQLPFEFLTHILSL